MAVFGRLQSITGSPLLPLISLSFIVAGVALLTRWFVAGVMEDGVGKHPTEAVLACQKCPVYFAAAMASLNALVHSPPLQSVQM